MVGLNPLKQVWFLEKIEGNDAYTTVKGLNPLKQVWFLEEAKKA